MEGRGRQGVRPRLQVGRVVRNLKGNIEVNIEMLLRVFVQLNLKLIAALPLAPRTSTGHR